MKSIFMSIVTAFLLFGCGGGGGGGSGGSSNLLVDGTGSKGLLSGAQVQAYTYDSNNVKTKLGDSVKTDANGKYTLSLPPTSKPVVIEITSIAGTKTLDETIIENGAFKSVDAPAGLVIRTGVSSLTANATVHANVYTEAAVNAALTAKDNNGNSVALTSDVFVAATGAIRATLPAGVNPFTIRGVNANDNNLTDNEKTLTALLSGVAKSGKDSAGSCTGDTTTGVTCAIKAINDASKIKVDNFNKATFDYPTAQQTAQQNVITKAKTVDNAFVNTVKASLPNAVRITAAVDPVVITAQDGLTAFIKSMRDGFKATQTTLQTAADDFNQRTKNLSAVAEYTGTYEFQNAIKGCQYNNTNFICSNASGVIYTLSNGVYSYNFDYFSDGRRFNVSGRITPTVDNTNKSYYLGITANKVLLRSYIDATVVKKVSDTTGSYAIVTNADATPSSCINCSVSVSLIAKLYDNSYQNKYATLTLTNWSGTVNVSNSITTGGTLSGGLTFSSPDGDNITGSLMATVVTVAGDALGSLQTNSFNLDFSGTVGNTSVVNGSFVASRDFSRYNPSQTYSITNLPKDNITLNLTLANSSGITVSLTPSLTDLTKRSASIKFAADTNNFVTVSGTQQFNGNFDSWPAVSGSKYTITSSSGDFTAESDASNGSFTGPLKKGSTTIGQITNNVIYVNGQEISLY